MGRRFFAAATVFCALLLLGCISGGGNPTPAPATPTPTPFHRPTPAEECGSDSDCVVSGCANQWCVPLGYGEELPCRWSAWNVCIPLTSCGCVEGVCDWKPNEAFLQCKANPQRCPFYAPPTEAFILECNSRGGEVTALPDAENCTVSASCSADLRCANSTQCPLGFACKAGTCAPSENFCGGTRNVSCAQGYACVPGGTYYAATGACRKRCNSTPECGNESQCVQGFCSEPPPPQCYNEPDCAPGNRCVAGKCVSAQGLPCTSPGWDCPSGFYCLTDTFCRAGDTCTQINGTCEATFVPENLTRLCGKPTGSIDYSNVTGIAACSGSRYFRVLRQAYSLYGYADATGTIFRECGASAPPSDPYCGGLDSGCVPRDSMACEEFEETRFVRCPPPYSANPNCPDVDDPVCARLRAGSIPALRHTEWAEYANGCLGCNDNSPTQVVEGFWKGKC
ncbi:MAG: hypothetical protein PHF51_05480 [Candidatus ainarchaeum sp.]|nr:hypothetical protein [Candidatus ainarchaeum sp.]